MIWTISHGYVYYCYMPHSCMILWLNMVLSHCYLGGPKGTAPSLFAVKVFVLEQFVEALLLSCFLVSWARRSRCAGGTVAHGKGGEERLVAVDRFSWTLLEYWRHQSDWRSFNIYIYLLYWSHDKALLILLTRLRRSSMGYYEAGASGIMAL